MHSPCQESAADNETQEKKNCPRNEMMNISPPQQSLLYCAQRDSFQALMCCGHRLSSYPEHRGISQIRPM